MKLSDHPSDNQRGKADSEHSSKAQETDFEPLGDVERALGTGQNPRESTNENRGATGDDFQSLEDEMRHGPAGFAIRLSKIQMQHKNQTFTHKIAASALVFIAVFTIYVVMVFIHGPETEREKDLLEFYKLSILPVATLIIGRFLRFSNE